MANPILGRSDSFNQRTPQAYAPYQANSNQANGYPQQGYAPYAQQPGYQQAPYQQGQYYGAPQQSPVQAPAKQQSTITYDDVIAKTGITLLLVMITASVSFKFFSQISNPALMMGALLISAIGGFITVMIVAGRRVVPVAGVVVYALLEGVFIGLFTMIFEGMYPGIAVQAVGATFAAAAATLAAYKFLNIRVTPKFRKMVLITTVAFAAVMLVNLVLALFGIGTGIRGMGLLGFVVALIGAGLAVFNLIVDFDYVETAVENRAPATESWRAALGITVTMVWLYTEILRILSYLRR